MPLIILALLIIATSALLSTIGVGWTRQISLRHQMLDIPNERSSHVIPTPRGGGLSIVVIVIFGTLVLAIMELISWETALAMLVGGGVAGIGYIDDRSGLSPLVRAIVHLVCAVVGLIFIGGMPPLDLGFTVLKWGVIGHIIGVIGIVWMINLYNFMDGIDGLAGSEAVYVFGVTSVLMLASGISGLPLIGALLVGSGIGFLRWNWPTAKIFMGDVASGFLGYAIAILAIGSGHAGFALWIWLILLAVFVVDTTVTVVQRVARGEKWYHPHRSHTYQHLAQRWHSHLRVTLAVLAINVLWLTPLAVVAFFERNLYLLSVSVALLPLVLLALRLGAGRNSPLLEKSWH